MRKLGTIILLSCLSIAMWAQSKNAAYEAYIAEYRQVAIEQQRKHGIPASVHFYPMGGHGWGYNDSFPYKLQWKNEMEKWLRELLP
jgi:hypothetical protein